MRTKSNSMASLLPIAEAIKLARQSDDGERGDMVRRSFGVTVKALNQDERSVDVVVSTDTLDAHGDVVDQDWDLKRYKRNPIVLFNHGGGFFGSAEDDLPIGYAKDVAVRGGQLEATLVFVDVNANPLAEKVWQGFRQKSLKAVSAGFRPHTVSRELDDDFEFYRLSDNELYEISVCPIPANPDAVSKSKDADQLKALHAKSLAKAAPVAATPAQQSLPIEGANKEPDMDTKELEDKIKALELSAGKSADAMATTTKALETANAKVTELTASLATSEKSLTEEKAKTAETEKRAKSAEDAVITAGVDALVGKKIKPSERDEQVELALSNKALFDKLMAKRDDLPMATQTVVVAAEKGIPAPPTSVGLGDDALASIIDKQNNSAPLESYGAEDVIQDN